MAGSKGCSYLRGFIFNGVYPVRDDSEVLIYIIETFEGNNLYNNNLDLSTRIRHRRILSLTGFTLVEVMIVVTIMGLLLAIALPNFLRARNTARATLCMNNMRLIGHAVERYVVDNNLYSYDDISLANIAGYIKGGIPECPADIINDNDDYTIAASTETDGVIVTCKQGHGSYDTGAPTAGL